MFVVALTGDIGAGKSTMARIWRDQGAEVLSADEIAREQWYRSDIRDAVVSRWGSEILASDGSVDLLKIRRIGFSSGEAYQFMCSMIHPPTFVELERRIRSLRGWVVVEIPLLFETGLPSWVDWVVCVTAPFKFRQEQGQLRGWELAELERRERWLMPMGRKCSRADEHFENNGTLEEWIKKTQQAGEKYSRMASAVRVETTCASPKEAERIAKVLLSRRLAACANISPCSSLFRWDEKITRQQEYLLSVKTLLNSVPLVMACMRGNHSYECPCIEVKKIYRADPATLAWISESCSL